MNTSKDLKSILVVVAEILSLLEKKIGVATVRSEILVRTVRERARPSHPAFPCSPTVESEKDLYRKLLPLAQKAEDSLREGNKENAQFALNDITAAVIARIAS